MGGAGEEVVPVPSSQGQAWLANRRHGTQPHTTHRRVQRPELSWVGGAETDDLASRGVGLGSREVAATHTHTQVTRIPLDGREGHAIPEAAKYRPFFSLFLSFALLSRSTPVSRTIYYFPPSMPCQP